MKRFPGHAVFITGELSGDLHAGRVAVRMLRASPGLRISALGGPHLAAAGAGLIGRIEGLAVVGVWEVLRHYPDLKAAFRRVLEFVRTAQPELLVLVDFPGFNLPLLRRLRPLCPRTRIVYYITPQVWAWKYGRVRTLRACADAVVPILPFEKRIFAKERIPAFYFGHPLASDLRPDPVYRGRKILFMPGSRMNEVRTLLPVMARVMALLPGWTFLISRAPTVSREELLRYLPRGNNYRIVEGRPFREVSCVVAASGTATLEASLALKPCVVLYRLHLLSWIGFRLFVRVRYVSLTNILLGRAVLPEFVAPFLDAGAISRAVRECADPGMRRSRLLRALRRIRSLLVRPDPWGRTASFLLKNMGRIRRDAV